MSNIVYFRPSAFYFRKDLRATRTKAAAQNLSFEYVTELELLYQWTADEGLAPRDGVFPFGGGTTAFDHRSRIEDGDRKTVITCGLAVILEHEALRQWLRVTHDRIPPRWYVSPSERRAKRQAVFEAEWAFPSSTKSAGYEPAS